jgi:CRP/FNR family transcriptional regulator, dissimilatory nitrate respiration regulator
MIAIMCDDIARYLRGVRRREFAFRPGEAVFHIGDPVRLVHFVSTGSIHLIRHQKDGAALVLQRAGPGSILAEASIHSDRYHCDARAVVAASTWAVPRITLMRLLAEDTEFAQAWVRRLGQEIQHARMQAEIVSVKTVSARLDAWLAWRGMLPPKGEWVRLAAEISVSPEALYREMARRRGPPAKTAGRKGRSSARAVHVP